MSNEEARAQAYRNACVTRTAFQTFLANARAGDPLALAALFARTLAIAGPYERDVCEGDIENEESNEQIV